MASNTLMRHPSWLFAVFAVFAVFAAPAAADDLDACTRGAVDAVQKRYEAVVDLHAEFEQTSRSRLLGGAASQTRSAGEVVFAKPGKMRWSYTEPEPSLVVSDGNWLWIYDPGAGEAQKLPVTDGAMSGAAVQFLLGEGEIELVFRVVRDACSETSANLTLWPREPASYEKLRIETDPRSGDLLATEITDLLGNVTRITFREIRTNQGAAPALFTFTPPEGVETIELAPPAP